MFEGVKVGMLLCRGDGSETIALRSDTDYKYTAIKRTQNGHPHHIHCIQARKLTIPSLQNPNTRTHTKHGITDPNPSPHLQSTH
jgi:hypothetical protein